MAQSDLEKAILKAFEVIMGPMYGMAIGAPEFQQGLQGFVQLHLTRGGAAAFRDRMIRAMQDLGPSAS